MNASVEAPPEGGVGGGVGISGLEPAPDPLARHMRRALDLAERGRGRVEPNPVVGAVIVTEDGLVVGEGFHARYGGPHAEVEAIAMAGEAARGGTLYVTLEPCNHHGKTPPCVDAILRAGIRRVVAAMRDPHALAAGGADRLRAAGVEVAVFELPRANNCSALGCADAQLGLLAAEARRQNAPFLKRVKKGLPFVTLKWAMTLDGKIASIAGDARWISSPEARDVAHRMRDRADAVLVGIGTALADDPELTTRIPGGRDALRVVVDARARLPLDSKLVQSAKRSPVLVAVTAAAPEGRVEALRAAGVEVLVAGDGSGGVDLAALARHLASRADRPVTNLVCEGGGRVNAALLEAGLVDRVVVFVAPKILGGATAPSPVEGAGRERMEDAIRLSGRLEATSIGPDAMLTADLREPEEA